MEYHIYEPKEKIDLKKIAESGQCFRMREIQPRIFSIIAQDKCVKIQERDGVLEFWCSDEDYHNFWTQYFDLEKTYNSSAITCCENDEFLQKSYQAGEGIRILRQGFFESLISFIISQRKSIPAIKQCIEKLCTKFGTRLMNAISCEYFYTFPTPHALASLTPDDLKDCGVGYRGEYIIEASKWYIENQDRFTKDCNLSYESALKELQSIRGVGVKVANCVCLFGLHYLEACPIDVWMQKIIDENYNSCKPEWMMKSDISGLLQQFAFYYKRLAGREEKKYVKF